MYSLVIIDLFVYTFCISSAVLLHAAFMANHSLCLSKFISTTMCVLKGKDCLAPLSSCCVTVDFTA